MLAKVTAPDRIVFSSDDLPPGFDDRARISAWREFLGGACGPLEVSCPADRPFSQRMEKMQFGEICIIRLRGTTDRIRWTARSGAAKRPPEFFLCFSRTPMWLSQLGRDAELDTETAALGSYIEHGDMRWNNDLSLIVVPEGRLRELVADAEDLIATPLQRRNRAQWHLRGYVEALSATDEIEVDADLAAHVGRTLTDLIALTLAAGRDTAEIARTRGLRAARLQQIITEMRTGFSDPAFSARHLARKLDVSARYIQDLLQEAGMTFSERVLELRLQRARTMLMDLRHDRMKVGEIAAACGFNEIPHFNRCFRRRFGMTPTQSRGSAP